MYPFNRSRIIAFASILVLLVSAVAVLPARADDGTPPPPAPTTSGSSFANTPKGTDVVVMDRSGKPVSLASQKAAHIIAAGDPIWCPLGVAPKSGAGGCSPAYAGFSAGGLSTWLSTFNPNKNGVIWIEESYDSSVNDVAMTSLTFDGLSLTNMALFSLAIKGGWNGMPGSTVIDQTDPSTFDGSSLIIRNWHNSVTLSDIVVTGVLANPFEAYGLSVQTDKGGITLNRVQVIDNYADSFAAGAHLNTILAPLGHPAPVTVNDSVFSNNYGFGLLIQSDGAVNLRNLAADFNGNSSVYGYGAYIDNYWDNPNQPVTMTGTNEFKSNYGSGLVIQSFGAVSLNNITAYTNYHAVGNGYGVVVNNFHDITPSIVKLTGTNLFSSNAQDGLNVISNGNIYANNLTSTDNGGSGAVLDNCHTTVLNGPCNTIAKTVTLTGINTFNRNSGGDGLDIFSSGAITISQVTANNNNGLGADLENCAYNGSTACQTLLPYNIVLTNASTFLNNVSGDGLYIDATGSVSLKNITANFNNGAGVVIYNDALLLKPRPVTMLGTNVLNGNNYEGMDIYSYGAVTLSNITANDNGQIGLFGDGVYIDNEGYDANAGGLGVGGDTVITRMPVKLTGVNNFNHNFSGGIEVISAGAISVSNVAASNNGNGVSGNGVYLNNSDNWYPGFGLFKPYAANVTLSGFSFTENNKNDGLDIYSFGVVTAANITSNFNGDDGAQIETYGFFGPESVTLSGVNTFFHNGFSSGSGDGLYVLNSGKITISNLSAVDNRYDGAYLDNFTHRLTNRFQGVTLTGFNTFQQNGGPDGLYFNTDGSAVLNHINADGNIYNGVTVLATKNLTLTCGSAFNNASGHPTYFGFYLWSGGTMTLKGVQGFYNATPPTPNPSQDVYLANYAVLHQTASCP